MWTLSRRRTAPGTGSMAGTSPASSGVETASPGGEVELRLEVKAGTVRGVTVYTDAMDWTLAPAVERALTGSPFRRDELVRRLEGADLERTVGTDLRCLLMGQDI